MNDAIVTDALTKYYGPRAVVNQVNLRVPTGSVYGLLGRNGAGKSTFIKMLLGLVHPDSGQATLLGDACQALSPSTRARIAYLAEQHPLYRWMTVGQAVRFTRRFYDRWSDELVGGILDHFQLASGAKIRRLSNGQRAQVSLALALGPDPELLILDDPTLGLDTVVRRDFLESMIHLIQASGRTVLFSSHILGDVERVADRIGIMIDGVLRVDCPTEHFKDSLRRIVFEFAGGLPDAGEWATWPGLVSSRQVGSKVELVVVGFGDEHERLAASVGAVAVDVLAMNLEDAFIAYTRERSAALPRIEREALSC